MEVGQKVILVPINNRLRYSDKIVEDHVIKKIGRKYVEVWVDGANYSSKKFHIDTRKEKSDISPDWIMYLSHQEIADDREYEETLKAIRKVFGGYGKPNLSLDQLRKIKEVINENNSL